MLNKKVLIVEDEAMLREAYEMVLKFHDYDVTTAANGLLALDEIDRRLPDLILLDMLMPVMGGEQFLDESDILSKHKTVRVIIYSNLSDRDTVEKLIQRGVYAHVLKSSMAPGQLVDYIKTALD